MQGAPVEAMSDEETIRLSVGEPDFPTPGHIKEAGVRAIAQDFTKYTPQPGFDDLREAIALKFRTENAVDVSPEQVVVSCGGKHSLYNVIQCAVAPGDEVIVLRPYWFATLEQVRQAGGRPVIVDTKQEDGFQPDPAAIRSALTGATKAIVINSPCNPTGAVFSRRTLTEIAQIALESRLLVISDEVYEKILFDGVEHVSVASLGPEIAARTVTVNSVSKTHAMTGWRIGYAAMPAPLARQVTELQSVSTSGPCAIAQRAALAALTGDQSHVQRMVASYAERRRYLLGRVGCIEGFSCGVPKGTFYLFVDVSGLTGKTIRGRVIRDADGVADLAQEEANVDLLSCAAFGAERHIRLSFAVSLDALRAGMDRMERLLRE